ncbi:MAG: hypothetical protein IT337_18270 [Thermomicrobiales bacterium]|nr:hypothetical protein [Thermomicrobiales bacterium]
MDHERSSTALGEPAGYLLAEPGKQALRFVVGMVVSIGLAVMRPSLAVGWRPDNDTGTPEAK